jgi:hypothetical protein
MPTPFPEMTFRAAAVVPPMCVLDALLKVRMPCAFPSATVPVTSVPMKFPSN